MNRATRWQLRVETDECTEPAPGQRRSNDAAGVLLRESHYVVAAVCDGVSGSEGGGGEAAQYVLEGLRSWVELPDSSLTDRLVEQQLKEALHRTNEGLLTAQGPHGAGSKPPATTCALGAVYVVRGQCRATAVWVGDTRAAVVTEHALVFLTPAEQEPGVAAPAALGAAPQISPGARTMVLHPGQALLLFSDGVVLDQNESERVYRNTIKSGVGWERFLEQATQQPSHDDRSAVVIGLTSEPVPTAEREEQSDDSTDADSVFRAPRTKPVRLTRRWRAILVALFLVAAFGGIWLVSGQRRRPPASLAPVVAGTTIPTMGRTGDAFVVGRDGTLLPVARLLQEIKSGEVAVYTLERKDKRLALMPVGKLALDISDGSSRAALEVLSPSRAAQMYLDGQLVREVGSLSLESDASHEIRVHWGQPVQSWACEVVPVPGGLQIKPLPSPQEPRE